MKRYSYGEREYAFGQMMLTLRTHIGLTQASLANLLGVSRRAVAEWEAGSAYPKAEHLKQLIVLGVQQQAFPAGREAEEIRALWHAAHQKLLFDETWLATLLGRPRPALALLPPVPPEEPQLGEVSAAKPTPGRWVDWGEALAVLSFYGREEELATLTKWVLEEHCRVVSVLGMGGIGKSALAVSLMHRVAPHFEVVIWRSLRDAPDCEAVLDQCLQVLAPHPLSLVPTSLERHLGLLLEHLLASGGNDATIRLWEIQQTQPATCVAIITGHTNWVSGLAFAPDGSTLASSSWDRTVKLWDVESLRLLQTLTGHTDWVNKVAWSPDGRILASGGFGKTILLWDVESRSYRAALHGHTAAMNGVAFTPDDRSLLTSSEDGTLRLWDVASGQCERVIQGYAASLLDVDWSPDGTRLVSGGTDRLVAVWEADGPAVGGGTPTRLLRGHNAVVYEVGWSPDGSRLASSAWENVIRLWDASTGAGVPLFQNPDHVNTVFYGIAWSPDGRFLASGTYLHGVSVWDVTTRFQRWLSRGQQTWIRHVAWNPDGTRLVGGGDDGSLYVWDTSDGTLQLRLPGHQGVITSVAWSPEGTRLASAGLVKGRGELLVWDQQSGERMQTFAGYAGVVYAIAWGPSENLLVSGGSDGMLRWWDVQSGECVRVRKAHQGTIRSLRRSPDGSRLASCGDDGAITLWGLASGEHLRTLRRDRPYERLNITGIRGLSEAQKATLRALGAIESSPVSRS